MRTHLTIVVIFSLFFAGCASLPPIESSRLIECMTNTYASCQSFEDSGSIREMEIKSGETNVTHVTYQIRFARGRAYRMELHAERTQGVGPYSLIYHWDGSRWSTYNSIDLYYGSKPVRTNDPDDSVIGSGAALSFGLFPDTARLLHIKAGDFCGFQNYDRAEVSIGRLSGRSVYRLTLHFKLWGDYDTDEYLIEPQTYAILRTRELSVRERRGRFDITKRVALHSPKMNMIPEDVMIEFRPPAWTLPVVTYSDADGSSPRQAVVIKGVAGRQASPVAECTWLRQKYPGYLMNNWDELSADGKHYDLIRFTTADGQTKTVYFDITECFNK